MNYLKSDGAKLLSNSFKLLTNLSKFYISRILIKLKIMKLEMMALKIYVII